jgi:hypothetical protein
MNHQMMMQGLILLVHLPLRHPAVLLEAVLPAAVRLGAELFHRKAQLLLSNRPL